MSEFQYRSNVAAILRNTRGEILVCERLNIPGAWQFPQGGVDEGETLEQALTRELREEIGVVPEDIRIVTSRGPYRYLFGGGRMKKGYHGKDSTISSAIFSARIRGSMWPPNIRNSATGNGSLPLSSR
jgi:putative (di)nucleoside polyphosphate hydrolase